MENVNNKTERRTKKDPERTLREKKKKERRTSGCPRNLKRQTENCIVTNVLARKYRGGGTGEKSLAYTIKLRHKTLAIDHIFRRWRWKAQPNKNSSVVIIVCVFARAFVLLRLFFVPPLFLYTKQCVYWKNKLPPIQYDGKRFKRFFVVAYCEAVFTSINRTSEAIISHSFAITRLTLYFISLSLIRFGCSFLSRFKNGKCLMAKIVDRTHSPSIRIDGTKCKGTTKQSICGVYIVNDFAIKTAKTDLASSNLLYRRAFCVYVLLLRCICCHHHHFHWITVKFSCLEFIQNRAQSRKTFIKIHKMKNIKNEQEKNYIKSERWGGKKIVQYKYIQIHPFIALE